VLLRRPVDPRTVTHRDFSLRSGPFASAPTRRYRCGCS
jgi:hypothetical protein